MCTNDECWVQVYLVDYGLANRFLVEGVHKPYKEDPKRAHDGTCEYASRDAHKGVCECSVAFTACGGFGDDMFDGEQNMVKNKLSIFIVAYVLECRIRGEIV
jgi:hypothetical protein